MEASRKKKRLTKDAYNKSTTRNLINISEKANRNNEQNNAATSVLDECMGEHRINIYSHIVHSFVRSNARFFLIEVSNLLQKKILLISNGQFVGCCSNELLGNAENNNTHIHTQRGVEGPTIFVRW